MKDSSILVDTRWTKLSIEHQSRWRGPPATKAGRPQRSKINKCIISSRCNSQSKLFRISKAASWHRIHRYLWMGLALSQSKEEEAAMKNRRETGWSSCCKEENKATVQAAATITPAVWPQPPQTRRHTPWRTSSQLIRQPLLHSSRSECILPQQQQIVDQGRSTWSRNTWKEVSVSNWMRK